MCWLTRHRESDDGGGFYCFVCTRCGATVWRANVDHAALFRADAAIMRGDFAEAERIRREALGA